MKHFLSESATWRVISELVDPAGKVVLSEGEAVVSVGRSVITNMQWLKSDEHFRRNDYRITPISATEMTIFPLAPDEPVRLGMLRVEGGKLFFKWRRDDSSLNGWEIVTRWRSTCYSYGAFYDGDRLLHNLSQTFNKMG